MNNLFRKIQGFRARIWNNFRSDCKFSSHYGLLRLLQEIARILKMKRTSESIGQKRDQWIQNYLSKLLHPVVSKYLDDAATGSKVSNAPIWVCWWTGLDNAPELVKCCVKSIYKNAGNHPIRLITSDNYSEYIEIPEFMLSKAQNKKMGIAHLADYIRVKLLSEYGGLWLDATIFCSQPLPDEYFELPFFTLKGPVQKCGYVSDMRWVTFCLGGWKGNVIYRFLADAFEKYWSINDYAVDYLFFDHMILTAYAQIPLIKKLIDAVPDNNVHRDDLQAAMNAALPASSFDEVVHADTVLYKLSWRETYLENTADGKCTIFGYFIDGGV